MKCISQAYHQRVCSAANATDVHPTNIIVSFLTSPASMSGADWVFFAKKSHPVCLVCLSACLSSLQKNIMR